MSDTNYKINLLKERENKVTISLKKKTNESIQAKVNLILDISGSMHSMYHSGKVQEIVERIYPIASKLTTNEKLGIYIFNDNGKKLTPVTMSNFEGYVSKNIVDKVNGGTNYAPVMRLVSENGLFQRIIKTIKRLFGIKSVNIPVYNIFITDGSNSDRLDTEYLLIKLSKEEYFWQYLGIGYDSFSFLKKLDDMPGRYTDNADFFSIDDIGKMSDEDLYDKLLTEFPNWLKDARSKGIIK